MTRRLVVGNWKMNLLCAGALELVDALAQHDAVSDSIVDVVVCPPFTVLADVGRRLHGISLGGQNCHVELKGAFTGEISAEMLADAGCTWVILGHSERRRDQHETDGEIGRKVLRAIECGLRPIVCIGEQLADRQQGHTTQVLQQQLDGIIESAGAGAVSAGVIAYEPVWAIGTGLAATAEQAQEVHAMIRGHLAQRGIERDVPLLYGGSVAESNAAELFGCPDIYGALVGGASLKPAEFARIIHHARQVAR